MSLNAEIELKLEDFSLSIAFDAEPGETIAIVGPNGAGKSTTVRALTGLDRIDAGRISIGGVTVDSPSNGVFVPPHERRVGVAFQDGLLFPHLRVRDNVAFGLTADRRTKRDEAERWLALVGLDGYGDRKVTELSGGEARRVAVARALITNPDLVVLDEPFAGLDVGARQLVRRVLNERLPANDGVSILITHDPADAHALANRIVALEDGRVSQIGTPDEIRTRPATKYLADLVGVNLIAGVAADGRVTIADDLELAITDRQLSGEVLLTVAPSAVALHASRPSGSPRNTWQAVVVDVFGRGDVVRVQLDDPVAVVADVTPGAIDDLNIVAGQSIWVAIKATSFNHRSP